MSQRRKVRITRDHAEQEMRDREVLRANKELAGYFKGERTEREARAALKIIKAFVRDRERLDAKSRPPLPGVRPAKTAPENGNRKVAPSGRSRPPKPRPRLRAAAARSTREAVEPLERADSPQPPELKPPADD